MEINGLIPPTTPANFFGKISPNMLHITIKEVKIGQPI